jgi:hypothetical protein
MWLPREERVLLKGYFTKIKNGKVDRKVDFSSEELLRFIKSSASPNLPPDSEPSYLEKYKTWLKEWNKVINANNALIDLGLITSDGNIDSAPITISLTIKGYRLGQRYNSIGGIIVLWYIEYMWLFVVLGAIIGAVTLAVTIFKN